jgi:hypothetical protein
MIKVNGSHEFLKARLKRALERQYLTLNDAYRAIDSREEGNITVYEL